jgi:hypothetical protein
MPNSLNIADLQRVTPLRESGARSSTRVSGNLPEVRANTAEAQHPRRGERLKRVSDREECYDSRIDQKPRGFEAAVS